MSNAEAMRAALELIEKDIEERPIAAVIYTAASVNHYGGVGALLEDAAAAIPIIAPRGFLDAAGTENLFTENSSRRQSEYYMAACFRPALRAACSSAKMKPLQMVQPPT